MKDLVMKGVPLRVGDYIVYKYEYENDVLLRVLCSKQLRVAPVLSDGSCRADQAFIPNLRFYQRADIWEVSAKVRLRPEASQCVSCINGFDGRNGSGYRPCSCNTNKHGSIQQPPSKP